jgi:glycine cleavage system aminomethyltransferase T
MPSDEEPRLHRYPAYVRESPYLEFAIAEGAIMAWPYNRMWLPASYGRDRRVEYEALLERVTLWDVGCERALELTGPDAVAFADYLLTRDITGQTVGRCRHATACDEDGVIICEALVLRLNDERVWICHGPADFPLWARAVALHTEYDVEVHEAPVSPLALQGPRALDVMEESSRRALPHCRGTHGVGRRSPASRCSFRARGGAASSDTRCSRPMWSPRGACGRRCGVLPTRSGCW